MMINDIEPNTNLWWWNASYTLAVTLILTTKSNRRSCNVLFLCQLLQLPFVLLLHLFSATIWSSYICNLKKKRKKTTKFNEANWRYAYFENIHIKYTRQRHYYHGNMRYMIELFDKYFIGGKNSFHLFKKGNDRTPSNCQRHAVLTLIANIVVTTSFMLILYLLSYSLK